MIKPLRFIPLKVRNLHCWLGINSVLKQSLWFNILDFVWLNIGIEEQLNKKMIYFDSDTECMLEMCCTHRNVVLYLGQTAFQRANV